MIAGTPGAFKSVLALNMVVKWADEGIRTLYLSADGDEFTVCKRLCGILTGENQDLVERRLEGPSKDYYRDILLERLGGKVEFEYARMPWLAVVEHVKSYEQVYGAFPDVIVVDNLIDFASSVYAFDEMQEFISNCDELAKKTRAHVLILHHAKLASEDKKSDSDGPPPGQPPADWEIQGRMTQFPTLVLTLGAVGMQLGLAVVKNRNGPQYRNAEKVHYFQVNYSMRVAER